MKETTVGSGDLAAALGVSARMVRELDQRGLVSKTGPGRYLLFDSVRRYCDHLRKTASGRGGEDSVQSLTVERARLAREQADSHALKNATLRRDLVSLPEVETEWSGLAHRLRSGLLAVPSRVRQMSPHFSAHDVATIDREIRDVLTGFADDGDGKVAARAVGRPEAAAASADERLDRKQRLSS